MSEVMNEVPCQRRIKNILAEISGVRAQYGVSDWEFQRLTEWQEFWKLSEKQEKIVAQIEAKIAKASEE